MFRKVLVPVVGVGLVLALTAVVCELGFRLLLFSKSTLMEKFREPSLYADYYAEGDWWKLYYLFGKKEHRLPEHPPEHPHPLLGWIGDFAGDSYRHQDFGEMGSRRPVLLYGDSFAHCLTSKSECFQGILNSDKDFAKQYFLLNYGVPGYGVDQIYLLLKNSLQLYENPYVVIGLYTRDLDRSIMLEFVGQKPYFDVVSDDLVLKGIPVEADQARYLANNQPKIWSYLYRLWLYQDGRPWRLREYLRGAEQKHLKKRNVNERIIFKIIDELEARHIEHMFLIFSNKAEIMDMEWREPFVRDVLKRRETAYVSARTIITDDIKRQASSLEDYYLPDDGHPSAYQNLLISKELKRIILNEGLFARAK